MNTLTLARPVAALLTVALAAFALVSAAVPAQALAYDSKITGKVVGPDGKPLQGIFVSPFTAADQPIGSSDQDANQYTSTQADGSFSFLADSSTVYKVRFGDFNGGAGRKPLTFADKWYGGVSGFDIEAGYNSGKQVVIATPGVVNLGTTVMAKGTLPKFGVLSPPKISGELKYGKQLFASPGTWVPRPLMGWTYVWYRGTTRIGAGQTYHVGAKDIGQGPIRVVASASQWAEHAYTESKSATVSVPAVQVSGVTIQGDPQTGKLMTATIPVPAGMDSSVIKYIRSPQWYRNGSPIPDATQMTYRSVPADTGAVLSFKAGGGFVHPAVQTAKITPSVFRTAPPKIQGIPNAGRTLTAYAWSWAPRPATLSYQWYRNGARITGATAKTYKLTTADTGKAIKVTVTGTKPGYTEAAASSEVRIIPRVFRTAPPRIQGTPDAGRTLTAYAWSWAPVPATVTYKWYRSGIRIAGATAKTYKLTAADAGKTIKVTATGAKPGYTTASASSTVRIRK